MPAYLTLLYLPRYSEPCTCHEVKSVVLCRIHFLCKCTRAFQPAPLQPSDVGETRWHRTYGRKVEKETEKETEKEKKKKKKKMNSVRKTASAENLLPTNQPWTAIYLGISTVQRTGAVLQFFSIPLSTSTSSPKVNALFPAAHHLLHRPQLRTPLGPRLTNDSEGA
jgi:hypothetical protein